MLKLRQQLYNHLELSSSPLPSTFLKAEFMTTFHTIFSHVFVHTYLLPLLGRLHWSVWDPRIQKAGFKGKTTTSYFISPSSQAETEDERPMKHDLASSLGTWTVSEHLMSLDAPKYGRN